MAEKIQLKKIEILDESGMPIYVFDMKKQRVIEEEIFSEEKTLRSSLIVAALQGLKETGEGIKFIETKNEKYVILMRDNLVINFILPLDANIKDEKLLIFIHSIAEGVAKINKKLGLQPDIIDIKDYIAKFDPIFRKYINKLIQKIF